MFLLVKLLCVLCKIQVIIPECDTPDSIILLLNSFVNMFTQHGQWCGKIVNKYKLCTYFHYNDVTMGVMASQITSNSTVDITICSGQHQRNIKAPRYWPLCGEFTGDRWKKPPFDYVIMIGGSSLHCQTRCWQKYATSSRCVKWRMVHILQMLTTTVTPTVTQ